MALDTIILDGDEVVFESLMEAAIITVKPGKIVATGKTTIQSTPICVSGDETSVEVPGCEYLTASHLKPGKGTLKIESLAADQLTGEARSGKKPIILKGSQFNAVFEVEIPAEDIKPVASGGSPIPDTTPSYAGKGQFIPSNTHIKAN
jgi:hypothetical protein